MICILNRKAIKRFLVASTESNDVVTHSITGWLLATGSPDVSRTCPSKGLQWLHLPNGDPEQTLAAPVVAGCELHLPHFLVLAAVHQHLHGLLHIGLQQVLQGLVVLVLKYIYIGL